MGWLNFDNLGNLKETISPMRYNTRAIAGTATVGVGDYLLFLTTAALPTPYTVNLPTAVGNAGAQFIFIDISGNANNSNVTIDANGAETIDGATTYVINIPRETLSIVSNGTAWFST